MVYEFTGSIHRGAESEMTYKEGLSSFQKMVEVSGLQAKRIVDEETAIMKQLITDDDFQTIMSHGEFGESDEAGVLAARYIEYFPNVDDLLERSALIVAIAKAEKEKGVH